MTECSLPATELGLCIMSDEQVWAGYDKGPSGVWPDATAPRAGATGGRCCCWFWFWCW